MANKDLQRDSYNGWAPGDTLTKCETCNSKYIGSGRSRKCSPCAYRLHDIIHALLEDKDSVHICNKTPELTEVTPADIAQEVKQYVKANPGTSLAWTDKGWEITAAPKEKKSLIIKTSEEDIEGAFRKGQFFPSNSRHPINPKDIQGWKYKK